MVAPRNQSAPVGENGRRCFRQRRVEQLETLGQEQIVGVHEGDVLGSNPLQRRIASRARPPIATRIAHVGCSVARNDLGGRVDRSVIRHDDLARTQ